MGVLLDRADSLGPPLIAAAGGISLLQRYLRFRRRRGERVGSERVWGGGGRVGGGGLGVGGGGGGGAGWGDEREDVAECV